MMIIIPYFNNIGFFMDLIHDNERANMGSSEPIQWFS